MSFFVWFAALFGLALPAQTSAVQQTRATHGAAAQHLLRLTAERRLAATLLTNLSDYVGTYADTPGHAVEIVAGDELFAVVDDAKYKLRSSGVDEFVTVVGQTIPFRRDAKGRISGYVEAGTFHPRLSPSISAESAALARPRPVGQGSPDGYRYHVPTDLRDGIASGDITQTELGVKTANLMVRGVLDGTYRDVHSILLYQHGKLVLEEYFYGYGVGRPHQLRSATKSVVSALAGIAIDRGAVSGVNERVLPRMTYTSYANPDPRKAEMTLGNFLSMQPGLDCNDHSANSPGRETVIDEAPDWVKATLDLPLVNTPGSKGFYCSGGVAVVGRLVENAVHVKLPDFAQENLFGPLGMSRADWVWNYDLTNANKEYAQIHLRPRDMLKLGILFASEGKWQGRRVISSAWVRASLEEESRVDDTGYGYFWWRPGLNVKMPGGIKRVDMMAAQGNGGQKIYLLPQYDLVAVFTAGDYNSDGAPPNKMMIGIVLPALLSAPSQSASESGDNSPGNDPAYLSASKCKRGNAYSVNAVYAICRGSGSRGRTDVCSQPKQGCSGCAWGWQFASRAVVFAAERSLWE